MKDSNTSVAENSGEAHISPDRREESEVWYRTLFERMQEVFFVCEIVRDETGLPLDIRYLEANPACLALAKRKREEMVGHTYLELFGPNPTFDIWLAHFSQVSFSGEAVHFEQFAETTGLHFDVFAYSPRPGQCAVIMTDITERRRTEDSLKKSQHLLQLFVEHSPAAIAMFDREMRYITVSRRFLQDYGLGEQDLTGRSHYEVFPEISETIKEIHRRCLLGAIEKSDADPFPRADGRQDWVRWEVRPWYEEEGTIGGIILFSEVITESKHAESEIHATKAFLEKVIEMSPFSMWVADKEGVLLRANRALCEALHVTEEAIVGHYNLLKDENLENEGVMPQVRAVFERHEPTRFSIPWKATDAGSDAFKGGRDVYIDVSIFPILNAQGELTHVVGQWVDITEQKSAEEKLRESERRFFTIFHASPIGILLTAFDEGKVENVNEAFLAMMGFSRQEVLGHTTFDLNLWVDHEKRRQDLDVLIKQNRLQSIERKFYRKSGEVGHAFISAEMIELGDRKYVLSMFSDITEQKRAEEERERLQGQLLQAQKMESIGHLAGGVAHDFNNLLGVIIGQAEMALAKIPVSDPSSKHLEEILDAAQRSAALTSQLLAFARKQTINPRLLDMNETISASIKMLRRLIGEDIDLVWQPGRGAQMVRMDPIQVEQILTNLLVNARDAIKGVGKVVIETKQVEFDEEYCERHVEATPGDYTLLAVSDNGRGMDQQTVAHIFEPFFTTKEVGEGTGMGLATVFGIVKQNNGFIYAYSELGEGTTFMVYLPRAEGAVVSSTVPEKIASTLGGSETILVVEDESALLELCRDMLEDLGYRVLAAGAPGEAMKLARENAGNLHLLITDVVMPEMNGRMLADEIISISPGIKVLFTSGYTANVIVHRGVLDEGVVFLQKPYHLKDLAAGVREALAQT